MGIDIYAHWDRMSMAEQAAQITGFSIEHGHVGYLREAYHGEPYATRHLVNEAFESRDGNAKIPASVLRERLPEAIQLAKEREQVVYGRKGRIADDAPIIKSF